MGTKKMMLENLWKISRVRFESIRNDIKEEQLGYRIHPESNSLGFLLRHIAEVELMLGKSVFNFEADFVPQTFGKKYIDNTLFSNLNELLDFMSLSYEKILDGISKIDEDECTKLVKTPIGEFSLSDAIGRLITHTNYHVGQIGLIMKYGK